MFFFQSLRLRKNIFTNWNVSERCSLSKHPLAMRTLNSWIHWASSIDITMPLNFCLIFLIIILVMHHHWIILGRSKLVNTHGRVSTWRQISRIKGLKWIVLIVHCLIFMRLWCMRSNKGNFLFRFRSLSFSIPSFAFNTPFHIFKLLLALRFFHIITLAWSSHWSLPSRWPNCFLIMRNWICIIIICTWFSS